MAQQVGPLASKADDLSSIPRIHMVEGDNDSYKWSSGLHMHPSGI